MKTKAGLRAAQLADTGMSQKRAESFGDVIVWLGEAVWGRTLEIILWLCRALSELKRAVFQDTVRLLHSRLLHIQQMTIFFI